MSIETLSTVGYGDMAPVTGFGRVLGGVIAVLGIGMFALPAGILAQGLSEEMQGSVRHQQDGGAQSEESGRGARLNYCIFREKNYKNSCNQSYII